jgi:hypothetical protein
MSHVHCLTLAACRRASVLSFITREPNELITYRRTLASAASLGAIDHPSNIPRTFDVASYEPRGGGYRATIVKPDVGRPGGLECDDGRGR